MRLKEDVSASLMISTNAGGRGFEPLCRRQRGYFQVLLGCSVVISTYVEVSNNLIDKVR